ncbi:MAG: alcohol dehydrogenase catalytic domain-containing protein [Proteobacteria bacterium]|nr:alcohol dehydrogenase catalytic domain-containing protein [Pseudomonadota bacterium]
MKALVYTNTKEIIYREEPDPVPGPGEALIKVEATGICGSDMHAYHGEDSRRVPPLILGHEVAGTAMSGAQKGARVTVNPLMTCGECEYCLSGRSNLCVKREIISMRHPGALAEYVTIAERNLVAIPEHLNMVSASLAEPTAVALHAVNLAQLHSERPLAETNTLVIGGGAIGLLAALLMRKRGCRQVLIAETRPSRRESAERYSGCRVCDPISDAPAEDQFELVIDAVGGTATRKLAMRVVKPGGALVHIGLLNSGGELDVRKLTLHEVALLGVYCYTADDVRGAVDAIESGLLGDLNWVKIIPLADGAKAFADLDQGRISEAKVVLIP